MGTRNASTVPTSAMSRTDSEAEMENKRFRGELLFQTTMKAVRDMLSEGVIDMRDYEKIRRVFVEKYRPIIGTLLSEIELT